MAILSILKGVMKTPWIVLKMVAGGIVVLLFLGSLALNGTMLLWSGGALAVSSAITAFTGVQTVLHKFEADRKLRADKARAIKKRVSKRAVRMAAVNVAATPLEFLPFVGAGIALGATAWELDQSCEMIKEMNELDDIFEHGDGSDSSDKDENEVCGMEVPSIDEAWKMGKAGLLAEYNKLVNQGVDGMPSEDAVTEEVEESLWKRPKSWWDNFFNDSE